MNDKNRFILQNYVKLTEFLGRVLGPDYEIVLHDLTEKERSVIAIANNHISGREIGAPLTNVALQIIADKSYHNSSYRLHYQGISSNEKRLRSSTMFIKNTDGELIGLLCINFDDSRYIELSKRLLELCHPDAFVETNFQFNEAYKKAPAATLSGTENTNRSLPLPGDKPEFFHTSTNEVTSEAVSQLLQEMHLEHLRLTQEERILIIERLEESGIFLLKGAVKDTAEILNCSQASIYRYLSKIRNEKTDTEETL